MPKKRRNQSRNDYSGQSLVGANFSNFELDGADFSNTTLTGANFSSAELNGSDFQSARLVGCNFSNAELSGADFRDSALTGCNFSNSELDGADFDGAGMTGCRFTNAEIDSTTGLEFLNEGSGGFPAFNPVMNVGRNNDNSVNKSNTGTISGDQKDIIRGSTNSGQNVTGTFQGGSSTYDLGWVRISGNSGFSISSSGSFKLIGDEYCDGRIVDVEFSSLFFIRVEAIGAGRLRVSWRDHDQFVNGELNEHILELGGELTYDFVKIENLLELEDREDDEDDSEEE